MAAKINRIRLATWRDRFSAARSKREEFETEYQWNTCKDLYNGKHWGNITTNYEQLTFNFTKTTVDIMRDATFYRNPTFKFSTFNSDFKDIVMNYDRVFPLILRKIRYKYMTKLVLLDTLRYGFGYKYNGYSMKGETGNDAIKPKEVFSIYIPYDKVWLDPDASGLWDANFLFYQVSVPFRDFKNNPAYELPKDFKPTGVSPLKSYFGENSGMRIRDDAEFDTVELIHVFDRGEGRHMIMVDGKENLSDYRNWVYRGEWPLGDCNLFPINMLRLNENGLYPSGVTRECISPNVEYNKMESMKLNHAKRFNRKYQSNKKLEQKERDQLIAGEDGLIIEFEDPETLIQPIADADLDPAVYQSSNDMYMLIQRLNRVSEYHFGGAPTGETTATEATYVEQGASLGIDYVKDLLKDFCETDAEILTQLISLNYEEERYFEVAGIPVMWRGIDLEGANVNCMVDIESAGPPQSKIEKQDAMTLLQAFGQDIYINPLKVREKVLETFSTIKNPEEWLNSPAALQLIAQVLQGGGPEMIKQFLGGSGPIYNAASTMPGATPMMGSPDQGMSMPMETADPGAGLQPGVAAIE